VEPRTGRQAVQGKVLDLEHNTAMANHPYLFGDWLSVADILLMTSLDWVASERISIPEPLHALWKRVALPRLPGSTRQKFRGDIKA
jgi:glutathione S-transferase